MAVVNSAYQKIAGELKAKPATWLITGVAGFIGSNLLEALLKLNQKVVGLDNLATGHKKNLTEVEQLVGAATWKNFRWLQGDIVDLATCSKACHGVDYVLHQAALGSVPRSIEEPLLTNASNVTGFLNMLVASRDAGVKRFIYAASSSTYGDHPDLPKVEDVIGKPLSPYAVTKYVNELYADVFQRCYGFNGIGLRYFNIFGPRQDPEGAYAAVIPKWIASLVAGEPIYVNGDGETTRDFCFIDNAVQANLLAALSEHPNAANEVYNVALNERISLNQLFDAIHALLLPRFPHLAGVKPVYREFRAGDVRHSQADISKAQTRLGYAPTHRVSEGLKSAMDWYVNDLTLNGLVRL